MIKYQLNNNIATICLSNPPVNALSKTFIQILHEKMGVPATARASLGIYNSKEDIDALSNAIKKCNKIFNK